MGNIAKRVLTGAVLIGSLWGGAAFAQDVTLHAPPQTTGPLKTVIESNPGLPDHTIYRPADLNAPGVGQLPVVAFGNGACAAAGGLFRNFLSEIASHGYVAIALGNFGPEDMSMMKGPPPNMPPLGPNGKFVPPRGPDGKIKLPPPATDWHGLLQAIDWVTAENARAGSPYKGHLDVHHIAMMGQSCGGLQAMQASEDPRVTTAVILNSGAFPSGKGLPGISFTADDIVKLHLPLLFINGGPSDIAHPQATLNFAATQEPAVWVNMNVGHMGTYGEPQGGAFAGFAISWLDWRLKDDMSAAAAFIGKDCGLCHKAGVTIERKNLGK
jgi:dienelactone hydrolase